MPNVVTSVLADYRGYDTLGETTVIFTAGIGVMLLLLRPRRGGQPVARTRAAMSSTSSCASAPSCSPFILLFALYVQFHGDFGPAAAFQAGVITAGMVILYAIIFGLTPPSGSRRSAGVERMVPSAC